MFRTGAIADVIWRPLRRFDDARGWLCELFRHDELPSVYHPAMGYISATEPGITRGPHEHVEQADCFFFLGPSHFRLYLWDNRPTSATFRSYQTEIAGADHPMMVVIPAGVVHAYKNVGDVPGMVINCPNRLYRGPGRKDAVDEIRHEENRLSDFQIMD